MSKLLGVIVSNDLKWGPNVDMIVSKCKQKLFFLRQLKRAGVDPSDIVHIFSTAIRPILEYACIVWHTSLTGEQSDAIQNRALRISYPSLSSMETQDTVYSIGNAHLIPNFFVATLEEGGQKFTLT